MFVAYLYWGAFIIEPGFILARYLLFEGERGRVVDNTPGLFSFCPRRLSPPSIFAISLCQINCTCVMLYVRYYNFLPNKPMSPSILVYSNIGDIYFSILRLVFTAYPLCYTAPVYGVFVHRCLGYYV